MAEQELMKAVGIAYKMQQRIYDTEGISETPIVNVNWSPTTLSLCVGEECIWECQNSGSENLNFGFCWSEFVKHCKNMAKFK